MPIRTLLVDDEIHCLELLTYALRQHCPEVEIIGAFKSPAEARTAILTQKPDLVFLDIEMPGMNGFELLESLQPFTFSVVFSTAYDQFAIEALRVSAVDYLLKPLDEAELIQAVARVQARAQDQQAQPGLSQLLSIALGQASTAPTTVALPSANGLDFVAIDDILYCQSDSNYCHVILENGKRMLVSKTLKDIEGRLSANKFFRIHHSYLINLDKVQRYLKSDGGQVQMSNGDLVKVSRSKKDEFLARF